MNKFDIIHGDALSVLKALPSESVQCCVTSPPYYGLRDYGVPGQLGLETSPQEFVAKLVEIFMEVRRVLKDDGTIWLNLGDSYASNWPCNRRSTIGNGSLENGKREARPPRLGGLKDKDLMGIPWRVAFALQEAGCADAAAVEQINRFRSDLLEEYDGDELPDQVVRVLGRLEAEYAQAKGSSLWLRQDIIWSKPNPMPESVTDRCTKAHEYVFLLTKSGKYYFNQDAIREPLKDASIARLGQDVESQEGSDRVPGKTNGAMKAVRFGGIKYGDNPEFSGIHSGKEWKPKGRDRSNGNRNGEGASTLDHKNVKDKGQTPHSFHLSGLDGTPDADYGSANKKSVWTVTTQPFKEAHFATFPPKLIEPIILAGSREGDTVLDPFNGSGTTGLVSLRHRRNYVGIELNAEYIEIAKRRLSNIQVEMF